MNFRRKLLKAIGALPLFVASQSATSSTRPDKLFLENRTDGEVGVRFSVTTVFPEGISPDQWHQLNSEDSNQELRSQINSKYKLSGQMEVIVNEVSSGKSTITMQFTSLTAYHNWHNELVANGCNSDMQKLKALGFKRRMVVDYI